MDGAIPVNFAKIEARLAQIKAKQQIAKQVASADRLEETLSENVNLPNSFARSQKRRDRFKDLRSRVSEAHAKETKTTRPLTDKQQQDLAYRFNARNWELPADKLRALQEKIGHFSTADEIAKEVLEAFDDPTLADEAYEFLSQSTEGDVQDLVNEARASLQAKYKREIIAGRNIDSAAKSFSEKGLGLSPSELRDLYRQITEKLQSHNELFELLTGKYPFDQMEMAAAFLLKSLGFDLKSKGPSIQREELMRLLTEAKNLQSILWVYLFFKGRLKTLKKMYDQYEYEYPEEEITFEKLAQEYIQLVEERYPSIMKIINQISPFAKDDVEKMLILMQFRDASRELSPRLYRSTRHRQDLLLMIVETLEEIEKSIEAELEDEDA